MAPLTVGLVGRRAGAFVAGLHTFPDLRIVGLCEPSETAMARLVERTGVPEGGRFDEYEALLDTARPDVVVLGTPMHLHVPQAVQALERGIHVLSEVTAAVDLEECHTLVRAVRQAERRSGARYMMAENYCYRRDAVLVRAMAREGLFGECYFAEGEYVHDVKSLHHHPDGSPTWRSTWQVGKRGCTYGTHALGPALEFFGPRARVVTVSCVGSGAHTNPEHPHDDTCLMLCQLNTGGLIKVRLDMLSNRPHGAAYYSLQGTKGCYEGARGFGDQPKLWLGGDEPAPRRGAGAEAPGGAGAEAPGGAGAEARRARREPGREWGSLWDHEAHLPQMWRDPSDEALRAGHGGGDYFVVRDFIAAVRSGQAPPIDVYRALDYTVPGLISEQSIAAGGAPLPVPDFRQLDVAPAP